MEHNVIFVCRAVDKHGLSTGRCVATKGEAEDKLVRCETEGWVKGGDGVPFDSLPPPHRV